MSASLKTRRSSVNILLVGKTGHGKSATGNSILQRKQFLAKCSMTSVTKDVTIGVSDIGNTRVTVADTPGYADTEADNSGGKTETIQLVTEQIRQSLVECPEGYDAILYVTPFDIRYTAEEMETFLTIKKIIGGNSFRRHGILIFTHGDAYDEEMKMPFRKWCNVQTENLRKIIQYFGKRVVLMDNRTSDDVVKTEQLSQLLSSIQQLQQTLRSRRYTMFNFLDVEEGRKQLLVTANKEAVAMRVDAKVADISQRLKSVGGRPRQTILSVQSIKNCIDDEMRKLRDEDKETVIFEIELNKLEVLKSTADDIQKMAEEEELEEKRQEEIRERRLMMRRIEQQRNMMEEERFRQAMHRMRLEREMEEQREWAKKKEEEEQQLKDFEEMVKVGAVFVSAIWSYFTDDSEKDKRKKKK